MIDVQNQPGLNNIDIDKVGISDVSYPIEVLDKKSNKQSTTALINMYVDLPHQFKGTHMSRFIEVKVSVMNLCPCSKEISDTAAHNQRSEVVVRVRFNDFVWIEDIIALVEGAASCDLYALLKRPDEKYVSEHAYENPRFVEDIVRIIANELMKDKKITWFSVRSKNFESIHNHNAYAFVERDKRNL